MKKTLVAVAALATISGAMAQATISGGIQVGASRSTTTTAGASSTITAIDDHNQNTGLNLGVSEDLGDGTKFVGNIGLYAGIGGGNGVGNIGGVWESYGGLSGGFGTVKFGTLQTPQFASIANGDGGGGYLINNPVANIVQHQGGAYGTTVLIQSNSLQYTLPTFVQGLKLTYQSSLGEKATGINGTNHYAIGYTAGPLNAGYAYSAYKYSQTATDSAQSAYGTYDFGPAKLLLLWGAAGTASASGVSGTSVGINVPFGALTLMYNYGSTSGLVYNATTTTARAVSTTKQNGSFAGVSYAFSKRTTAYAAYYTESGNDGSSSITVGSSSKWNTTRLLLIHSF